MINKGIIVINSGSTSLKFALYELKDNSLAVAASGSYTEMPNNTQFKLKNADQVIILEKSYLTNQTIKHEDALRELIPLLESKFPALKIDYAGHRIVSGGERFNDSVILNDEILDYLDSLTSIEPTHQKFEVMGARALAKVHPHIIQTASFDTSFHQTMPQVAKQYSVSEEISQQGIRHWGFHGISYHYVSEQIAKLMPQAKKVITAHLGGGASVCAMYEGKSIDTSMQFGAITGLPMATRSGDFPADAIFYLLKQGKFKLDELELLLSKKSGLLGLSGGLSESMKVLEASDDSRARFAIEVFDYALLKYIGAYSAVLNGLDALIFTAGIGENDPALRQRICTNLEWLGLKIDKDINQQVSGPTKEVLISSSDSKVAVYVIPTNEELMIAKSTIKLVS